MDVGGSVRERGGPAGRGMAGAGSGYGALRVEFASLLFPAGFGGGRGWERTITTAAIEETAAAAAAAAAVVGARAAAIICGGRRTMG